MAAHQNELEILASKMDSERQHQQLRLRKKLEEKRRRKTEALRRKQEAELTKEMLTQSKELENMRSRKVCLSSMPTVISLRELNLLRCLLLKVDLAA